MATPYGTVLSFFGGRGHYSRILKTAISRQPAPLDYTRISIGDVGIIREGQFHFLFSAGSPLGGRVVGEDVPTTFEQLKVGRLARSQPRQAGCLSSTSVKQMRARQGATAPAILYVLRLYLPILRFKVSHPGPGKLVSTSNTSSPETVVQRSRQSPKRS